MGAYSKSSKADQGGIRRLCNHLLQSADHGPELKQKAQEAKPGSAKRGPLTEEQNLWVRDYVARVHWRNLSSVEKERWNQAPQPNTTTARNEPASASAPATRTSAEPSTLSTSSSTQPPPTPATQGHKRSYQPLDDVAPRQSRRRQDTLVEELSRYASSSDIASTIAKAVLELGDRFPDLQNQLRSALSTDIAPTEETQCSKCAQILAGLGAIPQFQPPNPPLAIAEVRVQVDALLRNVFSNRSTVQALGFPIGRQRWERATGTDTIFFKRGRPSKVDDPQMIELVQDRLQAHSQSSSRLCVAAKTGDKQEWQLVRTMTKKPDSIFEDEPEIFTTMSNRTMKRIIKKHLWQYKPAWSESDWCQYCFDLDQKVVPQAEELVEDIRHRLSAKIPQYFEEFDSYATSISLQDQPGLFLRQFDHFIWHHENRQPCRTHRVSGNTFPCGLGHLRARAQGFTPVLRDELRDLECDIHKDIKAMSRLLDSYLHHRAANAQQKPILKRLVDSPPPASCTLLCDFKELMTLPILGKATGESFFATANMEISCFGCVLTEHMKSSTTQKTFVNKCYVLLLSDTLDHTCTRANHCIDLCLKQRLSKEPLTEINLESDAAGHFRGFENLYHHCVLLPKEFKCTVRTHFGCEKHMKAEADELFGWVELALKRAKSLKCTMKTLQDLKWWIDDYCSELRKRDRSSPFLKVLIDNEPKPQYGRRLLVSGDFFITRTYCLSASLASSSAYSYGVHVYNHVFSSRPTTVNLTTSLSDEPAKDLDKPYRKGYYGEGRANWDTAPEPLEQHEATALTRRQDAQKHALPNSADVKYQRQMDDDNIQAEINKKIARLQRRRKRSQHKQQLLQKKKTDYLEAGQSSSSSDSSSSTSSSDA